MYQEFLKCICGKPLHNAWGIFLAIKSKVIHGSKHKINCNCNFTGLPTWNGSDERFSHMSVFEKIRLITKIAFTPVWWCLTYSLLSLYYSTYEAVLDPINKVREVMRVILPSIKSSELTMCWFPYLIHNIAVRSSGTTPLIYCLQTYPVAQYQLSMLCQMLRVIMFLFYIK